MTPTIYKSYREEHIKIEKQRLRQSDLLNHILGGYIAIGVNEPNKYPKNPRLSQEPEVEVMTDEQMEKRARHNTIRMGGIINDN